MKLYIYSLVDPKHTCEIIPAPPKRAWMDAYPDKHAYRCLPLAIANNAGWQLLCPCDLEITFTGGMTKDDITVRATDGFDVNFAAESNFTRGIVTFYTNYIFQTEPGWQLLATGPLNEARDGMTPLTGIIETDWLPYSFTMNWQLTRPGKFHFKKGEPFCQIMPIPKNYLEGIEPEIYNITDNAALLMEKERFQNERATFRGLLDAGDPDALRQGWQRYYFKGQMPSGTRAPDSHVNKLRLQTPVDKRGTRVESLHLQAGRPPSETPARPSIVHIAPQTPAEKPAGAKVSVSSTAITIEKKARAPVPGPEGASMPTLKGTPETAPEQFPAIMSRSDTNEIFYMENFLSEEQCRELIACFERNIGFVPTTKDEFFKDRVLWMNSLNAKEQRARAIMQQARHAASYHVAKFFGETMRMYDDMPQLVKWWPGMGMPAHADNEHPDGSEHRTPNRKYAGVTFLNSDYEGGNFYLKNQGLRVPAKPGLLVGFRGDMSHMHGVTTVTSGLRYTMPMWLSTKESDTETIARVY